MESRCHQYINQPRHKSINCLSAKPNYSNAITPPTSALTTPTPANPIVLLEAPLVEPVLALVLEPALAVPLALARVPVAVPDTERDAEPVAVVELELPPLPPEGTWLVVDVSR